MSRLHTSVAQWGLISGIRQDSSDLIVVSPLPPRFSPEARKGQVFVVVEAEGDVSRGRSACELVANTLVEAYYADGSVSLTSSLRKAMRAANEALYRFNFEAPPHKRSTVGVSCAVIHGHDLFVTQVAPAQAYVSHAGKLRALPNPMSWTGGAQGGSAVGLSSALGTSFGSEPEFFRSVLQIGDTIVLTSSNVARLLGKAPAEQLISFSDAPTIAEALYDLCRSSHLPEAHAVAVEIVPELSVAARNAPLSVAGVSERSKLAAGRVGEWLGLLAVEAKRGLTPERAPTQPPVLVTEHVQDDVVVEVADEEPPFLPPAHQGLPVPMTPIEPITNGSEERLFDRIPVGDPEMLPPSAFIGEGHYGGVVRPPAVKRDRHVDLGDNSGVPVDFAALPQKVTPPPPTFVERMTLPFRGAVVGVLSGFANTRRRTQRVIGEPAAPPRMKIRGLSYRRERPRVPWLSILLFFVVIALLVTIGLNMNRRRDVNTVNAALTKVSAAIAAAEAAPSDEAAQTYLSDAETALRELDPLKEKRLLTPAKGDVWNQYQQVLQSYDQARASINHISIFKDFALIATLPVSGGQATRLLLGTDPLTVTGLLEDRLYVLDRGNDGGTVYNLEGGTLKPTLAPGQDAGVAVAGKIRDVLWRLDNPVALDRDDNPLNPIATAFVRGVDGWLANRLQGSELLPPGEIPSASFGGNLYLWDTQQQQLMKYTSGQFADLPTPWITDRKEVKLDQVIGVQIDGLIYLLRSDGTVFIFEGGVYQRTLQVPKLAIPIQTITRMYVTPDVVNEATGTVVKTGSVFLLDTLNERVIQINKTDGSVIQQIMAREHGRLNRLTDLAVDSARNWIYLANGDQILRAHIPDPPMPRSVQPAATATAESGG